MHRNLKTIGNNLNIQNIMELEKGKIVHLTNGETAKVVKELGRGGQGIVYLVEYKGQKMALKWYLKMPTDEFYDNLKENVSNGCPSEAFLWPKHLTIKEYDSCGYLMNLRPEGFYELSQFMLAHVFFDSYKVMLGAAMNVVHAFKQLHAEGYSYQDVNEGSFFIHPQTGRVFVCDNDNVSANNTYSGILGKSRYMAPEVVIGNGNVLPNKYSDRFSLPIILFLILFNNHPFEGVNALKKACLTEEAERKLYGSEPVFICDPHDKSNRPVRGVHNNVIRRWPIFPQILREEFEKAFSKEAIKNPRKRTLEEQWEKVISAARCQLIECPHCHEETFVENEGRNKKCMNCSRVFNTSNALQFSDTRQVSLTKGTKIFVDRDNTPDIEVFEKEQSLWLKNLTEVSWQCTTTSGKIKMVVPLDSLPVKTGIKISFGNNIGVKAEIVNL